MPGSTKKKATRLIFASGPLAGATVVVTRPVGSGHALRRRVLAGGGMALGLPGLSIRALTPSAALRSALERARTADIVIFVSPMAVRCAFALRPKLRFARSTVVCSVGAATARGLAQRGVNDVLWPRARQD